MSLELKPEIQSSLTAVKSEIRNIDFSKEIKFRTSRSGGKGGQHVNKVETRVELMFKLEESELLNEEQKALVRARLGKRINKDELLIIDCQQGRSQSANKKLALDKFYKLLEKAMHVEPPRKPTKKPAYLKVKRLETKRRRSEVKKNRKRIL